MQPPPQAVPSGVAGPPPAGNPRSMFWANSPYRKPANNAPVAPITRPLQPVTDPFAFNRQTLQNTPVGSSSKSSLPNLPGPALSVFSQWPGLPVTPTNAGDSSTGLHEPLSGTLSQPRADASLFPPASTPSSLPGLEVSRNAEADPSSGHEVQMLPHSAHYIPGVGPEQPLGGQMNDSGSGPDQPMNRHAPHDGAVTHAASPFLPQPQMPGQWGPAQGGPQPSYQHHSPYLEGPVQNMGLQAASLPHFPPPSSLHQGPGHESHAPQTFTPASLASGEGNEIVHQQSKNHPLSSFPPKHTFEQNSRIGNMWASPELKQNPGVNKEHLLDPAHVNPFTQGNSPENQAHHPPVAATNHALQEAASGALSMFFQGEETENEENLSSEKAGLDKRLNLDSFSSTSRLGHPPPPGASGVYQAFPRGPSSEAAQEGDAQPYFSQSVGVRLDKQSTVPPANDAWGDVPGTGTRCASGPQCENVENLEFVQNQEVLPRETLSVDPFPLSDHWRYDPRFTGSFDDDAEIHRDPYGEEADRRSIHSEHSARSLRSTHSLPSRRSSLSSHSHQSQIYRSHHVTGGSFEAPHAPGSFHGDYAYGTYASNFSGAHGFPEYSYPADTSWPAVEQVPSRPTSPEKFTVPHVCARFGPGGQLLKVIPNLPSEGQPALVEIHSLETLLQHTPEQEEMRSFPGPLGKDDTHKVDVINFAQNKATKCLQNESLIDKESASLLWKFIILLCRQNGTVVGTDIAELLLRDHRTVWLPGKSPNSLPINDPLQTVYQLMSGRMPAASTCCGDEKWGDWRPHLAMVLSNLNNNMDVESRTMATMGDTLASKGLLDAAHFCYLMAQVGFGVYTKKTTKLVLIGSNHSLPFLKFATNEAIQRTEAYEYAQSLGAHTCSLPNFQVFKFIYLCRLAEMGLATQAFHYCEVIAKSVLTQPGAYSPVLISQLTQMASQLRLFDPQLKEKPEEESFVEPAWLVQLQHVERQIQEGTVLWSQDGTEPQQCRITSGSEVEQSNGPGLNQQAGPQADNPLLMPSTEPLMHGVQLLPTGFLMWVPMFPVPMSRGPLELSPAYGPPGSALGFPESSRSDPAVLHPGQALPPTTLSLQESGLPPQEAKSPDPEMVPRGSPVRHSPPELSQEEFGESFADPGSSRTAQDLETSPVWDLGSSSLTRAPSLTSDSEGKKPAQAVKKEPKEPKKTESWFSRWLPGKKRTEAYLPDDKNKSIVWDEKKNQWVNLNEPEEEKKAPPPPPTSFPRVPQVAPTGPAGPPTASVNVFSRKAGGSRARYVDVLNPSGTQRSEPALAPADFFAPLAPLPIPSNLFVPNPDAEEPQPADGTGCRGQAPAGTQSKAESTLEPKVGSSTVSAPGPELLPSKPDGSQGGELSRCSSLSSLSQEVSRHFHQAPGDHCPTGAPHGGSVPFYNPAQLVQASVTSGNSRPGRIGQRKYAALN